MKIPVIGIIGINGKYGQWLENRLSLLGCKIIGSDLNTELSNIEVVQRSDVVIFSVPPRETVSIIDELVESSKPEQLWIDITSLKSAPIEAMLCSKANVMGLHPMCAPTGENWRGQTVVVCRARCNDDWYLWLVDLLISLQANLKFATPEEHDKVVAFVQVLPHFNQLVTAAVLRKMKVDVSDSLEYTSPFYRIVFSLMGRILAQNPGLYYDIQTMNPYSLEVLRTLESEARNLREIIESRDKVRFLEEFVNNKSHFGEGAVRNAFGLFEILNRTLADWSSEYAVTLRSVVDRPGVLSECLSILAQHQINLTTIRSEPEKQPGHCLFVIGIDRRADSNEVCSALDHIQTKIKTITSV